MKKYLIVNSEGQIVCILTIRDDEHQEFEDFLSGLGYRLQLEGPAPTYRYTIYIQHDGHWVKDTDTKEEAVAKEWHQIARNTFEDRNIRFLRSGVEKTEQYVMVDGLWTWTPF